MGFETVRKLVSVERGNVVLQVPEDDVQRYLDQGYNLIDEHGNVIQASVPRDLGTLQKAYVDHINEIESLKSEIETLKKKDTKKRSSRTKE